MERFEDVNITIYKLVFPAHSLGQDALTAGFSFGLGTCINDGDKEAGGGTGQNGQGGWSGWSPYGIVFGGKQIENNGLATLVSQASDVNLGDWSSTGVQGAAT